MKKLILILLIILSAYLGYRVGNGNNFLFDFIKLGICVLIFLGLTVIVGVVDLIIKKRFFIYPGSVLLFFLMLTGVSLITFKVNLAEKQEMANQIIIELEDYKNKNNHYPKTLDSIESIDNSIIQYIPNDNRLNYHLYYEHDGWHIMEYSSKTKEWKKVD